MKKIFLFLLFCLSTGMLNAQEICDNGIDDNGDGFIDLNDPDCDCAGILPAVTSLIPNPSFEDMLCCPWSFSQLDCAETWIQASNATSDYFNLCGFTSVGPGQGPPPPPPSGGSGYAGFYSFGANGDWVYKEMVGACLDTPLQANATYRISLFVARSSAYVMPLELSIYGTPYCDELPWEGEECPVGQGSWLLLGSEMVEFPDSAWQQVTIEFVAPQTIRALALGGPCGPIPGGPSNYYYVDELIANSSAEFDLNAKISESGLWCAGNLCLHADIDTAGGSWQWYRSGIALLGETADSLDLMPYGTEEVYTAVYALGSDCVSIEHTVDVEFFKDNIPDISVSPSCKGFSNGQAYLGALPNDTITYSYQWSSAYDTTILSETDSLMNVSADRYRIRITAANGCDTTVYFDIPEEDFKVSFRVSDTLFCVGEMISLTNTSDTHFMAYYWRFGNGDTSSFANPPTFSYSASGLYQVMLVGAGVICTDTTYKALRVDQPVLPGFEIAPPEVCVGKPVYIFPDFDSTVRRLEWTYSGLTRTEQVLQGRYQYAFDTPGVHAIRLNYVSRACPDTSYTDSVKVYPFPDVDLGSDGNLCLHGRPVYLKNLRTDPTSSYHQVWSTGDTAEFLKVVRPGTYTLSVRTEPIGCTTTESIEIRKDCYIDVPNVFTPNGDGHNDYFFPRRLLSEAVSRFEMRLFNRWGQVIFETANPNGRGWDGRFNDRVQPVGVYVYRIEVDFADGSQEMYEGNVTLLR